MTDDQNEASNTTETMRKFRFFTRGSIRFAISENEITAVEDWRAPTPLPNAPEAVLGVVGIQGRMLTVLDITKIAAGTPVSEVTENGGQRIVALRGDEQLALVIDAERDAVETSEDVLNQTEGPELLTLVNHAGSEFKLLNPKQLFLSAIQGRERRRRRF